MAAVDRGAGMPDRYDRRPPPATATATGRGRGARNTGTRSHAGNENATLSPPTPAPRPFVRMPAGPIGYDGKVARRQGGGSRPSLSAHRACKHGAMTDATDRRLAAQYEAYPYPARDPRDEAKRLVVGSPSHLREVDHWIFGARRPASAPLRALVAGGGTGDGAIMLAQHLAWAGAAGRGGVARPQRRRAPDRRSPGGGAEARQHPLRRRLAAGFVRKRPRPLRLHRLLRRAAPPARPARRPPGAGRRAGPGRRHRPDGLRAARAHRRLHDAGRAPPPRPRRGSAVRAGRGRAASLAAGAGNRLAAQEPVADRPHLRRRRRPLRPAAEPARHRLHRSGARRAGGGRPVSASRAWWSRCATTRTAT